MATKTTTIKTTTCDLCHKENPIVRRELITLGYALTEPVGVIISFSVFGPGFPSVPDVCEECVTKAIARYCHNRNINLPAAD